MKGPPVHSMGKISFSASINKVQLGLYDGEYNYKSMARLDLCALSDLEISAAMTNSKSLSLNPNCSTIPNPPKKYVNANFQLETGLQINFYKILELGSCLGAALIRGILVGCC